MKDMRAWTDEHRLENDLCAMCCEVVVIQNSVFTRPTIPMPEALYYFFLFIFILRIILRIVVQVYVEVSWKCAIPCGNYRLKFLIQSWSANTMQTLCITIIFFFSWKSNLCCSAQAHEYKRQQALSFTWKRRQTFSNKPFLLIGI